MVRKTRGHTKLEECKVLDQVRHEVYKVRRTQAMLTKETACFE